MLMSEQFTQSNALSTLLEDLRSVATIGARHGTSEQAGDWVVSIGTSPTVQQQWMQLDPIIQTRPRQVVVSVTERIRHGPDKGTTDVGMPFLDSGFQVSDDLLQRLQHAIAFFARWRSDPGRGDAHEAWAAGSHRMAGRRANPQAKGVGSYAPKDTSLLKDEVWLQEELAAETAVGEWLHLMDKELRRICPTHHAACNAPRNHTHSWESHAAHTRLPSFDAPQTTAACAIDYPAFGNQGTKAGRGVGRGPVQGARLTAGCATTC
jgi:hypothetical protein